MAARPSGYGLTAEVKGRIDGKYSENLGKHPFSARIYIAYSESHFTSV